MRPKPLSKNNSNANSDSELRFRLLLLERFALTIATAWAVLWLVQIAMGNHLSVYSFVGSLTSWAIVVRIKSQPGSRPFLANLFLFCNVMVMGSLAVGSGQGRAALSIYFPIVVFLTAHLVGFKVACVWSVALLVLSLFDCYGNFDRGADAGVVLADFMHRCGSLGIALWLSYEAEKFFNQRTKSLTQLTGSLKEKTRLLELAEETAGVGHWRWDPSTDAVELSSEGRLICCLSSNVPKLVSVDQFLGVWSEDGQRLLKQQFQLGEQNTIEKFSENLVTHSSIDPVRHVSCRGMVEKDDRGQVTGVFGTLRDDTQLRCATDRLTVKAQELNQLASFDPLTGLSNRFQFEKQFKQRLQAAKDTNMAAALLVLDMDGFKVINDTLGHATGDEVLKIASKRLVNAVREIDLVSRLGGDEFTVIIGEPGGEEEIGTVARRIVESISAPMNIDGQELHAGVSIGASLAPRDSWDPDELFTFADTAMYAAKTAKKGLAIYRPEMTQKLLERRSAENRLLGALERNEFDVVFQPQSSIVPERLVGFETLLRWNCDGKKVPPLQFIPLLESSGKIIEVGQWVLEKSCQQLCQWNAMGHDVSIAVNISPVQFRECQFVDRVMDTIQSFDVDPGQIEIEITEGLLIQDLAHTKEKLFQLKNFGMRISVDDFGTGYSSLAYLRNLPIDQLKIDRAFIKDIPEFDDGTIASSIIVLGDSLDMDVMAEGVETVEQLEFLKTHGCRGYQGNLLGRPLPAAQCVSVLESLKPNKFDSPKPDRLRPKTSR